MSIAARIPQHFEFGCALKGRFACDVRLEEKLQAVLTCIPSPIAENRAQLIGLAYGRLEQRLAEWKPRSQLPTKGSQEANPKSVHEHELAFVVQMHLLSCASWVEGLQAAG